MAAEVYAVVKRLTDLFEARGIRYLIGGSLASAAQGEARATRGVDFLAELAAADVAPIVAALEADFYVDAEMIRDAIERLSSFNVIHLDTMFKADVFVVGADAWTQQQMARRVARRLGPDEDAPQSYIASAEDTVLAKLRWYRMGGDVSDRQWRDVLGVLKVQADALDTPYMERWAAELGVTDLLDRAMDDAGLTG